MGYSGQTERCSDLILISRVCGVSLLLSGVVQRCSALLGPMLAARATVGCGLWLQDPIHVAAALTSQPCTLLRACYCEFVPGMCMCQIVVSAE